jgi:hypothetical protein
LVGDRGGTWQYFVLKKRYVALRVYYITPQSQPLSCQSPPHAASRVSDWLFYFRRSFMGLEANRTLSIRLDDATIRKLDTLCRQTGIQNRSAIVRDLITNAQPTGAVSSKQPAAMPKGQSSQNHR